MLKGRLDEMLPRHLGGAVVGEILADEGDDDGQAGRLARAVHQGQAHLWEVTGFKIRKNSFFQKSFLLRAFRSFHIGSHSSPELKGPKGRSKRGG